MIRAFFLHILPYSNSHNCKVLLHYSPIGRIRLHRLGTDSRARLITLQLSSYSLTTVLRFYLQNRDNSLFVKILRTAWHTDKCTTYEHRRVYFIKISELMHTKHIRCIIYIYQH